MINRDVSNGCFKNFMGDHFDCDGLCHHRAAFRPVLAIPDVSNISESGPATSRGQTEQEMQAGCAGTTITLADESRLKFPPDGYVRVPFRKGINHVIVSAADDSDAAYIFVIDTGASFSIVTPGFVAARGIVGKSLYGEAAAEGAHGAIAGSPEICTIRGLRIGNLLIERAGAVSVDLDPVSRRLGYEVHGIIGYNILSRMITLVDYAAGQLVFTTYDNTEPFKELGNPKHVIPFRLLLGAMIEVSGQVNDEDQWPFLVDLGAQISMITPEAVRKASLRLNREPLQLPTMGLGANVGSAAFFRTVVSSLRFGSLTFGETILYQAALPVFRTFGYEGKPAGILGNDLIGRYRVAIDYTRSELRFWNQ